MTTGKNQDKALEVRYQHLQSGTDALMSYLLSETNKIEDRIIYSLKRANLNDGIKEFESIVKEHNALVSDSRKNLDYSNSVAVGALIFADAEYYAMRMVAYIGMMGEGPMRELHALEMSKTFERTVEAINYGSLGYLNKAASMLGEQGIPDLAAICRWIEERQNDKFDFESNNNYVRKELVRIKELSPLDDLWEQKISVISKAIADIINDGVARHLMSLAAYADSSAALFGNENTSATLNIQSIKEIDTLIKYHGEAAVRSLLRVAPLESPDNEESSDKQWGAFARGMLQGIDRIRKLMSDEISNTEDDYRKKLADAGVDNAFIETIKAKAMYNYPPEEERRMTSAIKTAISRPEGSATLNALLNELVKIDSMRMAASLRSLVTTGRYSSIEEENTRIIRGIDEIRSIVTENTIKDARGALEMLDGRAKNDELPGIASWFAKRSSDRFRFDKREAALDGILAAGTIKNHVKIIAKEVSGCLSSYLLSLSASSNAAAGYDDAAVKNLVGLRKLDKEDALFYAEYVGIGKAEQN